LLWKIRTSYGNYTFNFSALNPENNTIAFYYNLCPAALGIDDDTAISFNIYPNPASDKIYLSGINDISKISIFDYKGSKILQQDLYQKNEVLSTIDIPNGIYFINMELKTRQTLIKKFVVAK
jgi:hypothetical protein